MSGPFTVGYGNATDTPAGFNLPLFKTKYILEYVRTNRYSKYIGMGPSMPIQLEMQLKQGGESITVPMMTRLKKRGVAGNMPLGGREEILSRQKHSVRVEYHRNGVVLTERDEHFVFAKALPQVRPHLMRWSKEQARDDITDALFMVRPGKTIHVPLVNPDPTQVLPGDPAPPIIKQQATAAELNEWLTNNSDRIIFGGAASNLAAGNFATSIGNVTASTDVFGARVIDRMKFAAEQADPHLTPIEIGEDGEEYWVIFCDPISFMQAQYDPVIMAFMKDARAREGAGWTKNPLRTGGDLEWNGCIIRKVQEMAPLSATVGRAVLVGSQAVCFGIGMDPDFREKKEDDYGHIKGIGITECKGVNKFQRETSTLVGNVLTTSYVDHGTVTAFTAIQ